ncbi:hypothetical protein [Candidatus Endomicrobiellum devescovinae]|jgi:hypothetical protein|uniref:hypothetical protein n=1 Tax=Candidatus Endomicrobiellum devescovinae TaxID=3242322 RepID=UPI00281D6690|nr:hypothetical protein [Endomicrobium sp.]MDR1434762.1 hypothetical protein [Endomicrobium sp.]MDR2428135.1 hypothetical protein [Endomicrobium sp.]MDR2817843.1 hypothetical protein [Endomicrobium sp.]
MVTHISACCVGKFDLDGHTPELSDNLNNLLYVLKNIYNIKDLDIIIHYDIFQKLYLVTQ